MIHFENPLHFLELHGADLARSGTEPRDIEDFAKLHSETRPYDPKEQIALRGMVAEIHNRYAPDPYLPGTEFIQEPINHITNPTQASQGEQ